MNKIKSVYHGDHSAFSYPAYVRVSNSAAPCRLHPRFDAGAAWQSCRPEPPAVTGASDLGIDYALMLQQIDPSFNLATLIGSDLRESISQSAQLNSPAVRSELCHLATQDNSQRVRSLYVTARGLQSARLRDSRFDSLGVPESP